MRSRTGSGVNSFLVRPIAFRLDEAPFPIAKIHHGARGSTNIFAERWMY